MYRTIRNFFRKYLDIITPVSLFALSALVIFFGIIPAVSKILELNEKVNKTRVSVNALTAKNNFLGSLSESDLESQLKNVVAAVPQDKSLASILGLAEQLTNQSGIMLQSFNLAGAGTLSTEAAKLRTVEEKAIGASLVPFSVNVSGPLPSVRSFISSASQVRRLLRFANFSISMSSTGTPSAAMHASLDAFYAPFPPLANTVEQSLPEITADDNETLAKLVTLPWLTEVTLSGNNYGPGTGRADPFSR